MSQEEMLEVVKVLSSSERLRVVGALVKMTGTTTELANLLGMEVREVFQHLSMLENLGIVSQRDEVWKLTPGGLEKFSRKQFEGTPREKYSAAPEAGSKTQKVLAAYLTPDGRIRQIPHEPAKLQIILDYLLESFATGVIYSEKEVNEIIRRFHTDTAGLRRDMIDRGMLERKSDGSQYWRPA